MNLFLRSIPTWFELVSLAFCIGSLTCGLCVLAPAAAKNQPDHDSHFQRQWTFFGAAVVLMIAATLVDLVFRTSEMSGKPFSTILPLLPAVILKTHFGAVWIIRMACLFLISFLVIAGRKFRHGPAFSSALLAISIIIVFTESASGHAADSGDFSTAEIVDFLHLAGALIWGGGLFTISLLVFPASIGKSSTEAQSLARIAERFSLTAGVAVAIIAATSLYNAWTYVGSLDALFQSPYGRAILAKIVFFALLLVLAAFNRSISVPRLREWAGQPLSPPGIFGRPLASLFIPVVRGHKKELIASRFLRTVRIEALLMLGLLFCVALLRHEVPARHFAHVNQAPAAEEQPASVHEGHMHMHHGGAGPKPVVRLETDPAIIAAGTPVSMKVHIEDKKGRPFEGLIAHHERILHAIIISEDLIVFAHIHPEDVGPITSEMKKRAIFPLRFTFPKAGKYLIGFDFATEEGQYSDKTYVSVSGGPAMAKPTVDLAAERDFGTYHVSLKHSPAKIKAGADTLLRFLIERNGKPITNLEPYLGAPMHLAIVKSDLTEFIHTHGFTPDNATMRTGPSEQYGPEIDTEIAFPVKGLYKIFSQVRHKDKVLLFDFTVKVE